MEIEKSKQELSWLLSAGIVGADIGTSVFYSTGILFPIVGYLAPIFVIISCLAMWVFKRTYEEGLAMSPYNGGAYSMILRSVGRRSSVGAGALTFVSYLATAAVSSLSGSYYLCSLFFPEATLSTVVFISFIPIIFFGLLNIKGIKEPAKIVTGIAIFHFVFLLFIGIWGLAYIGFNWESINPSKFLNFLSGEQKISFHLIAYGFAAAFLGITGFESAAQIVESMKKPHMKTLQKLYQVVVLAVSFTAPLISFCCLAVLTPEEAMTNKNALLSEMTFKLGGAPLKTILVINAAFTLFAATNTALVGFIGLATTMAKHGNLPQVFLQRLTHKYPDLQGYPFIAVPFIIIVMGMSALIAGEVKIAAEVYGIAFLGVMVSFSLGCILMRNKGIKKSTPIEYISKKCINLEGAVLSIPPLATGIILGFAGLILLSNANSQALFMLTLLLAITSLLMAYYRWGILEDRLVTHSDLRLAFGKFSNHSCEQLPTDLMKYILCIGTLNTRSVIASTLRKVSKKAEGKPFELIIFYAEDENEEDSELFYESLQRIVSQQVAPYIRQDIILTVKILPESLMEGLNTLKKTTGVKDFYFGAGHDPAHSYKLKEKIAKELEISIISVY